MDLRSLADLAVSNTYQENDKTAADRELYLDELAMAAYEAGKEAALMQIEKLAEELEAAEAAGANTQSLETVNVPATNAGINQATGVDQKPDPTAPIVDTPAANTIDNPTPLHTPSTAIRDAAAAVTGNQNSEDDNGNLTPSEATYVQQKAQEIINNAVAGQ